MRKFFKGKVRKTDKKTPSRERDSLEVSIVGGGFERFIIKKPLEVVPGTFGQLLAEGMENPVVVKIRGISDRPAKKEVIELVPVSHERVLRLMKNIVKAYLFKEGLNDIKLVNGKLDTVVGSLSLNYIAEKRHNLSKLAARLAKVLHVRVDFEQIGARDYAREIGGIGICGRELCCRVFLKEIPSITLDIARQQYLFAAPEKLSGLCGRLLWCLRFELPVYEELSKKLPQPGSMVETQKGVGRVVELNVLFGTFKVQYEDDSTEVLSLDSEEVTWEIVKS